MFVLVDGLYRSQRKWISKGSVDVDERKRKVENELEMFRRKKRLNSPKKTNNILRKVKDVKKTKMFSRKK